MKWLFNALLARIPERVITSEKQGCQIYPESHKPTPYNSDVFVLTFLQRLSASSTFS